MDYSGRPGSAGVEPIEEGAEAGLFALAFSQLPAGRFLKGVNAPPAVLTLSSTAMSKVIMPFTNPRFTQNRLRLLSGRPPETVPLGFLSLGPGHWCSPLSPGRTPNAR